MSSSLSDELKSLFIFDIEMEARECNHSILTRKCFKDLKEFKWADILHEMGKRQGTLAEVLLAVALPTAKIGNKKSSEALCPVIATVYGMLMMQRSKELSSVQKFITAVLANEQTHQKVLIECFLQVFFNFLLFKFSKQENLTKISVNCCVKSFHKK